MIGLIFVPWTMPPCNRSSKANSFFSQSSPSLPPSTLTMLEATIKCAGAEVDINLLTVGYHYHHSPQSKQLNCVMISASLECNLSVMEREEREEEWQMVAERRRWWWGWEVEHFLRTSCCGLTTGLTTGHHRWWILSNLLGSIDGHTVSQSASQSNYPERT